MPLDKSGTKSAFSRNVSELMHSGRPQNQALAIAFRVKRGRAEGGAADDDVILPRPRNPARMPPAMEDTARGMTIDPLIDASRAIRGRMTPDEAQNFAMTAAMGLISPMARGALRPATQGIRAYHGSPHDFDRFDISKIGTGEGAQSYGHGLYFAENPATAQSYRDALTNPHLLDPHTRAADALKNYDSRPEAIRNLKQILSLSDPHPQTDALRGAIDILESGAMPTPKPLGKMYEVNINAKPEQFLDWDAPLAKQAIGPQVAEVIGGGKNVDAELYKLKALERTLLTSLDANKKLGSQQGSQQAADYLAKIRSEMADYEGLKSGAIPSSITGQEAYRSATGPFIGQGQSSADASAVLREAGIPGIKYLDQGSRGVPDQRRIDVMRNEIAEIRNDLAKPENARFSKGLNDALVGREKELSQLTVPQTSNYVLFDDKLVDILRKYGIAGTAPIAAATMPEGQEMKTAGFALGGPPSFMNQNFTRGQGRATPHTGPINSAVGGRTDHHAMRVPSGSYVLPADHVSSLGQGNTSNGMAILSKMFGTGPMGMRGMPIKSGAGAPRLKLRADGGEAGNVGEPVPIYAAGGEYIVEPTAVAQLGGGDLKHGHAILDEWVKSNRKKHIKTLEKLPGPAKS